jgi:lipid II:glycine glycyltransferase (peptidoglycan interpeptide bridge formation enzyme)
MTCQPVADRAAWNRTLLALPAPHLLQSWEWGAAKAQTGWAAHRLIWTSRAGAAPAAAASLLLRRISRLPWGVAYIPKGPVLDWGDPATVELGLAGVEAAARQRRAIFVKIDPDVDPAGPAGQQVVTALRRRGWQPSAEQIQFRNTALLNLAAGEEALLAAMKPKWRYNIGLAERRGVQVRLGSLDDLSTFYALYVETGSRDGFIVRPFDYYELTWRTFMQPVDGQAPWATLLLAEVAGDAVAGLMLFGFGATAWYLYGASSERQRNLMPNHLLQWEAIRLAAGRGCTVYDLWGAPDVLAESDAMWGVWRFKEGFGAQFAPHIGAWDYPVHRSLYRLYTDAMPRVLDWMRGRHRQV